MSDKEQAPPRAANGLDALRSILSQKPARDMLFVGQERDARRMLAGLSRQPRLKIVSPGAHAQAQLNRRWHVGVVCHALATLGWPATQALLSRLRDINCRTVYLCWRHGDKKGERADMREKLRSLAYTFLGSYGEDSLARFDIDDYKQAPDWLNASDWARPELWNKFRW